MCVSSSLTYAAETWGNNTKEADVCYRSGLKTALGVRQNTNCEIVHIETGKFPLHCRVAKSQFKFWQFVMKYVEEFQDSALSTAIKIGLECKLPYLKYYQKLVADFNDPLQYEESLKSALVETWKSKIAEASVDIDSKLGTYYSINHLLKRFVPAENVNENERITITRFRCGSHSLAIETGRFSNKDREHRLCKCGLSVQTIWQVFDDCH